METLEKTVRNQLDEQINLPKLELLVRLGLLPMKSLPIMRRALIRLKAGSMLTPEDRSVISTLLNTLLTVSLDDPAIFQRLRTIIGMPSFATEESLPKTVDQSLKRMPEGMLATLATNVKSKERSGGKVSPSEKKIASRAKNELRRRRDNARRSMSESYESAFLSVMKEYNINNVADLPNESVKEFFNKVEQLYNSGE